MCELNLFYRACTDTRFFFKSSYLYRYVSAYAKAIYNAYSYYCPKYIVKSFLEYLRELARINKTSSVNDS